MRKAEVARHAELSRSIAPLIVGAIRSEIKNSREMMVEALYPITGRLVTAAVANAFRDLVEQLNARIDAMVSADVWRLRMRALLSGRSMAEVALAEADSAQLKRVLLLERGSGRVLAAWPDHEPGAGREEITSGLIAAVTEFVATAYAGRGGELRMLDLGASGVALRASARLIVAAEIVGALTPASERRLDAAFQHFVEGRESEGGDGDAAELAQSLAGALRPERKPPSKTPLIVLSAGLAGLALWASIEPATRAYRQYRIERAFSSAMREHRSLAEFPLRLEINHDDAKVVLRGLSADEWEPQAVLDAISGAAKPYAVERDVKVLQLRSDSLSLDASRASEIAQLHSSLQALQASLKDVSETVRANRDGAPAKLRRMIESFAIFFSDGDNLAEPAAAAAGLDELARLLKLTQQNIRIVGYADEVGTSAMNRSVSRQRSEKVAAMLAERGVPRERMAIAPRSTLVLIADSANSTRNRRVVFEAAYENEFSRR